MKAKPNLNSPTTRDEALNVLGEIRADTIALRRLQLEREAQIKLVDDHLMPKIQCLEERIERLTGALEAWAASNPAEFGPLKSIECAHGRFGFRICPPSVKTIRPFTWAKVLESMQRSDEFAPFIRIKKEVDKEALIAARSEIAPEKLRKIGIKIEQTETFFVEPTLDDDLLP